MKKRPVITGLTGAALVSFAAGGAIAAPQLRVQVDQKGDFVLIGNTLGHECAAGTPATLVGTVGNCGNTGVNDSAPDVFWRADSPAAGQASASNTVTVSQARSTAVLSLPPGAAVTHAYLYWGARRNAATADMTATIERAGSFSTNVAAIDSFALSVSGFNFYQSVADVTSIVQSNGPGAYRVGGVDAATFVDSNNSSNFAGWWMAVFYQLDSDPPRNLTLFDGFDVVNNMGNQNVMISGFVVPNAGFDAKLGVVTFEGDSSIPGDQLMFNGGAALSDAENPADNFFNSTRSTLGTPTSTGGDLPRLTGTAQSMAGMDLDVVDVTAEVSPGDIAATITATSSQDQYFLAGFITAIATFKPDFTSSNKTATDSNGGALLPGDVIEYTIVVTNTGNDTSVDTVLTDAIPTGATYVPGSLRITQGPNAGTLTDLPLDDVGEYDAAVPAVTVRLGANADNLTGGELLPGESTTVIFQVIVDADASGTISNQATISAGGSQGSPPEDVVTDGNGGGSGAPPTDVIIDQCGDDAQCAAPTPHCNTLTNPNTCVECAVDAHCPATLPTCDVLTTTCECNPGPIELCDGVDNTCDGQVDEGNPGGGVICASGEPGVCAEGKTNCTGGAVVCTPNVAPGSLPEVCGDATDEDCDGNLDNDCPDADGDAIPDYIEDKVGTDKNDADSDDDGVSDGAEPSFDQDSDGDGLVNALDPDSDNDGLFDGTELGLGCGGSGTNAAGMHCTPDGDNSATKTDPLDADTDDGGVSDGNEDKDLDGVVDAGETDPNNSGDDLVPLDSDMDGLGDDLEISIGTSPMDADSDDDGLIDGQEPNPADDTDGDGLINALDEDSDNDGLFDGTEAGKDCSNPATNPAADRCVPDGDGGVTTTSPLDPDTDKGGVSDGSEDANQNGEIDVGETNPNLGADDTSVIDMDGDGLSDLLEVTLGSDPLDADTDDDGLADGEEANPASDTDGDSKNNIVDPDSDGDGLFDGTEAGKGCSDPDTNAGAGTCVPDGDGGATTTNPLDPDTDDGGVSDGEEDSDKDGVVDQDERDPNKAMDDVPPIGCVMDSECGGPKSGKVCDVGGVCVDGCRGAMGNGCPDGDVCSSTDETIGTCGDGAGGGGGSGGGNGGGGGGPGGRGGSGGDEGGFYGEGSGLLCAARPGKGRSRGAWLLFMATGAALVRRRRSA